MARRRLTPEEEALWARVAATASPMRVQAPSDAFTPSLPDPADPPPGDPPARASAPVAVPKPHIRATIPQRREPSRVTLDLAPDPHAAHDRAHPHMDRRRFEKLRRGRLAPEARLDLHGMTSDRAHGALVAFILAAHGTGLRLVLVITGKGRPGDADAHAPHRHGVLRHSLPHWLNAPPLAGRVLQLAPAHQSHGGGGAFYVYLRRIR
jgi:DNA-nicking Smr family endonuclease